MPPRRRRTIGADPLDAVMPRTADAQPDTSPSRSTRLVTVGISFERALLERARNAVYWTPGLTLAELVSIGLMSVVDDLEKQNDGEPFTQRPRKNHPGQRVQLAAVAPKNLHYGDASR